MSERYVPRPWERRRPLPEAKPRADGTKGGKSPYRLGRDFERSIRGRLERRDYFVMRSQGSKGKADLLAVGRPCLAIGVTALFVQCKRRGEIGSAEWNDLFDLATSFGGWPVLASRASERTVSFYRLDARREPRRPGRPWTLIEPADLSELIPPPTLLGDAA